MACLRTLKHIQGGFKSGRSKGETLPLMIFIYQIEEVFSWRWTSLNIGLPKLYTATTLTRPGQKWRLSLFVFRDGSRSRSRHGKDQRSVSGGRSAKRLDWIWAQNNVQYLFSF